MRDMERNCIDVVSLWVIVKHVWLECEECSMFLSKVEDHCQLESSNIDL